MSIKWFGKQRYISFSTSDFFYFYDLVGGIFHSFTRLRNKVNVNGENPLPLETISFPLFLYFLPQDPNLYSQKDSILGSTKFYFP